MATPFLIIDGYNLLHAAGLAKARYGPGDLERQRHQLLVRLAASLSTEEKQRCTVVFDAQDAPHGCDREFQHDGIAVLFAEPGCEADDMIEQLVARHSAIRQLIVVSSDHRLQRAARIRRGASLDSEAFLDRLSHRSVKGHCASTKQDSATSLSSRTPINKPETQFWLREFGEIDLESLAAEVNADGGCPSVDLWQQELDELQKQLDDPQQLDRWLNEPRSRNP